MDIKTLAPQSCHIMDGQTEAHWSDMICQRSLKMTDLSLDLEFHSSNKGAFQYITHPSGGAPPHPQPVHMGDDLRCLSWVFAFH